MAAPTAPIGTVIGGTVMLCCWVSASGVAAVPVEEGTVVAVTAGAAVAVACGGGEAVVACGGTGEAATDTSIEAWIAAPWEERGQGLAHRGGGLVALGAIDDEGALHGRRDPLGGPRGPPRPDGRGRLGAEGEDESADRLRAGEGRPPRERLVEDDAQRPDVAAVIDVAPGARLLGRHVER